MQVAVDIYLWAFFASAIMGVKSSVPRFGCFTTEERVSVPTVEGEEVVGPSVCRDVAARNVPASVGNRNPVI